METRIYRIKGMHCASCASIIERTVKKIDGVSEISVNTGTEKVSVSYDENVTSPEIFNEQLTPLGYTLETKKIDGHQHNHNDATQSKQEKLQEVASMKIGVMVALPLAAISSFVMVWEIFEKYQWVAMMNPVWSDFFHYLMPVFATYILATLGKPYLVGVYRFFRYGKANMDTLIGLGTSVAFLYSFIISAFSDVLSPYLNVEIGRAHV